MRRKLLVLLCGLVAVTFASSVRATDPNTDGWEFKAAPYLWAVNLDGDMTVTGNTVSVDVNIIDIIEESESGLDTAFSGSYSFPKRKRKMRNG